MNFFEHQELARQNTRRLVVILIVTVLAIVASVHVAVYLLFWSLHVFSARAKFPEPVFWNAQLFAWVCAITAAIVLGGTIYKMIALSSGANLASWLGGRPISPNTADLGERRLMNVVEEMAIASGLAVPTVFVLEREPAINAFAAGFTPNTAVVAVTAGARDLLSRDELQAVVAHEFGHILNADIRMNLRLIGILHGILLIGLIGYSIFNSAVHGRGRKGTGTIAGVVFAVTLIGIGYIGVFFGRIIKAAISRQREFLADATAVNLTRNPTGMAGALAKIARTRRGSRLRNPEVETASHMYFGPGLSLSGIHATHPPLDERIRRIAPTFALDSLPRPIPNPTQPLWATEAGITGVSLTTALPSLSSAPLTRPLRPAARRAETPPFASASLAARTTRNRLHAMHAVNVVHQVGQPTVEHLKFAERLMQSLTPELHAAVHDPQKARAVVWALLMDEANEAVRQMQTQIIRDAAHTANEPEWVETVAQFEPEVRALDGLLRLPLIELAMPALRQMNPAEHSAFMRTVNGLIRSDGTTTLLEFALSRMLDRQLTAHFFPKRPPRTKYVVLAPLAPSISRLISAIARDGHTDEAAAQQAFAEAVAPLNLPGAWTALQPATESTLKALREALDELAQATPGIKRRVIFSIALCVCSDGHITVSEAEMLRAICDTLDSPMPPLIIDPPSATTATDPPEPPKRGQ